MGIEHPVLGLLTFALMAAFVVGAVVYLVLVGVEVQELVLSAPVVDGYAGCFSAGSLGSRYAYDLSLLVANSGRVDLRLERLYLGSDAGSLEVGVAGRVTVAAATLPGASLNVTVYLYGFSGEAELRAGQRGLVWVSVTSNASLYTAGKPYPAYARLAALGEDAFAVREAWFAPGETPACGSEAGVALPPPPPPAQRLDIVLFSRATVYWDSFDDDPVAGGRLLLAGASGCSYAHTAGPVEGRSGLVYLQAQARDSLCVLLVKGLSLPASGTIYIAFSALNVRSGTADQPARFGGVLTASADLQQYYMGGFDSQAGAVFALVRSPAGTASTTTAYTVNFNTWYHGFLELSYTASLAPGTLSFATSDGVRVSRSLSDTERFAVPFPGLGMIKLTSPRLAGVYYDSILVAVNARPDTVRVEGLSPGWVVKLRSLDGAVVAEAVARAGGVAVLDLAGVWAARYATIEVYGTEGQPARVQAVSGSPRRGRLHSRQSLGGPLPPRQHGLINPLRRLLRPLLRPRGNPDPVHDH